MDAEAVPATTPSAPSPAQMSVPDLAKAINERMSAMLTSFRMSVQRAIEIGDTHRCGPFLPTNNREQRRVATSPNVMFRLHNRR
jgi:hypothetical protein